MCDDGASSHHVLLGCEGSATGPVCALLLGLVYNVTPYMDYHPGGEDELMKAAGIDGTDLFDQVRKARVQVANGSVAW